MGVYAGGDKWFVLPKFQTYPVPNVRQPFALFCNINACVQCSTTQLCTAFHLAVSISLIAVFNENSTLFFIHHAYRTSFSVSVCFIQAYGISLCLSLSLSFHCDHELLGQRKVCIKYAFISNRSYENIRSSKFHQQKVALAPTITAKSTKMHNRHSIRRTQLHRQCLWNEQIE